VPDIGFRFEAIRPGANTRPFTPTVAGTMSFDLTREVPRTITGVIAPPDQWAVIDVRTDQIKAYLIVDGTDYPMGFFAFTELTRQKDVVLDEAGDPADMISTGLGDRCTLLIRNTGAAQTILPAFDPSQEMITILSNSGLPYAVAGAANLSITSITWDGSTTDLSKIKQLGTLAGHRPLWADNNGVLRSVASQVIDTEIIPLADLQPVASSVAITDRFLTAPNRVIVSDNSSPSYAIRGQWDAPASAPHSEANRGYVLTRLEELQGLGSGAHAENVAATIGEAYTARSLSARILPTSVLDGPQIISYDGANWLVTSWEVAMTPGADMSINAEELIP